VGSRLRGLVDDRGQITGESEFIDRLGSVEASEVTVRGGDTQYTSTPHSRRRLIVRNYDVADLIDKFDVVKRLNNPESNYARKQANGMGRKIDRVIIAAANGDAHTGKDGTTLVALPAGQKIVVGATGLTLAKLLSARELLDKAEVDPMEARYAIVPAKGITDLLNTTEIKSADYNTVKALAAGAIDTFMGFKFIRSELLEKNATGNWLCEFYAKSALAFGYGIDVNSRIDELPGKRYSWQVYTSGEFGAERVEDERLVQVEILP
jgi:hypothetical protein